MKRGNSRDVMMAILVSPCNLLSLPAKLEGKKGVKADPISIISLTRTNGANACTETPIINNNDNDIRLPSRVTSS